MAIVVLVVTGCVEVYLFIELIPPCEAIRCLFWILGVSSNSGTIRTANFMLPVLPVKRRKVVFLR